MQLCIECCSRASSIHARSARVSPTDGDRLSGLKRTKNCRLECVSLCVFPPSWVQMERNSFFVFFFWLDFFCCVLFVVSLLLLLLLFILFFFHFRFENAMCKMHSSVGWCEYCEYSYVMIAAILACIYSIFAKPDGQILRKKKTGCFTNKAHFEQMLVFNEENSSSWKHDSLLLPSIDRTRMISEFLCIYNKHKRVRMRQAQLSSLHISFRHWNEFQVRLVYTRKWKSSACHRE